MENSSVPGTLGVRQKPAEGEILKPLRFRLLSSKRNEQQTRCLCSPAFSSLHGSRWDVSTRGPCGVVCGRTRPRTRGPRAEKGLTLFRKSAASQCLKALNQPLAPTPDLLSLPPAVCSASYESGKPTTTGRYEQNEGACCTPTRISAPETKTLNERRYSI